MAITVISPASGGQALAPLAGSVGEAAGDAGGFGSLLGQLLAAGKGLTELGGPPFLQADARQDMPLLTGTDGPSLLLPDSLPEGMQALLLQAEGKPRNETEEPAASPEALLAALQAPLENRSRLTLGQTDTQGMTTALTGPHAGAGTAQHEMELALLQNTPANLAVQLQTGADQPLHPTMAPTPATPQQTQLQAPLPELKTPLQDPNWPQEFGEKIIWMARNDQQQAQLNLNPAHLGPLRITLNMEGETASAMFTAATPEVRQAIEDAMPRLREMLANAGISLGHSQVGTQSQQQDSMARQEQRPTRPPGDGTILEPAETAAPPVPIRRGSALVDLFA